MTNVTLSIPDDLGAWAEARASEARLGGVAEYVAALLRRERESSEHQAGETARLRRAWEEGLVSGPPVEGNFDVGDVVRRGQARLEAERQAG